MDFIEGLLKVGGKLGIVQIVSTTAPAEAGKIPTRKLTLKELATEISADQVRVLSQSHAELSCDFSKIFEAADIAPPPGGWTVDKLIAALRTPPLKDLDRPSMQKCLLDMLTNQHAHVHEVVADAVARDKALDAYEESARKKFDDRQAHRHRKIADAEAQIKAMQEQLSQLKVEVDADTARWKQWHDLKIQCEKDMAWALGYLLEKPPITIDQDHP